MLIEVLLHGIILLHRLAVVELETAHLAEGNVEGVGVGHLVLTFEVVPLGFWIDPFG